MAIDKSMKVMVVDDFATMRRIIKGILKQLGFSNIVEAEDGSYALKELEKVEDVNKIEMGVHGVLVRKGFASGVFLPQVATETGWSKEEFMNNLCAHKAGLLSDAWKTGEVDIYIFTAEVFAESKK